MYGLIIFLSTFFCVILGEKIAKKQHIEIEDFWKFTFWAILAATIGARTYHVIDFHQFYLSSPTQIFNIRNGGLSILGAIIGILIYYSLSRNKNKEKLMNIGILLMPLGQIFGRLGNYFNKELIGHSGQPLFLYEMVLNFILLIILTKQKNNLLYTYLIGYGAIRLVLEPLRTDVNFINIFVFLAFIAIGVLKFKRYAHEK